MPDGYCALQYLAAGGQRPSMGSGGAARTGVRSAHRLVTRKTGIDRSAAVVDTSICTFGIPVLQGVRMRGNSVTLCRALITMPWANPMVNKPCELCRTADPATVLFSPAPFVSWRKQHGAVDWAHDVYRCKHCKSFWRFTFHPKDMYCETAELIPEAAEPLLLQGTEWPAAWEARHAGPAVVAQYLHLYFERTPLRWREAAQVLVADTLREGGDANALDALRGLMGNTLARVNGNIKAAEVRQVWEQLQVLAHAGGTAGEAWQALAARAVETLRISEAGELAERNYEAERAEAASAPKIALPYSPFYTERIAGPEPQVSTIADNPRASEVMRRMLAKLAVHPFAHLGPGLAALLVLEFLGPASPAGEIQGFAFFPICLMGYAATASVVAGRWKQSVWKLHIDRFSMIFQLWGALLLAFLFTLVIGLGLIALDPEELGYRKELNILAVLLFLVAAARLWPAIVTTFVYRGYIYYQSVDVSDYGNSIWIGPTLRTAWRISGQPKFFTSITLPLLGATASMIGLLELTGWAWWVRVSCYFVALPLLVQFADEAVDHWRIITGESGVDR